MTAAVSLSITAFQSTPSVGRATKLLYKSVRTEHYFNPRPPWGGRLQVAVAADGSRKISIHALRGEGDVCFYSEVC